jgi:hypothetical protein
LLERLAVAAKGGVYHFFGCRGRTIIGTIQQQSNDSTTNLLGAGRYGQYSLYEDELEDMIKMGVIQLHELAFSRQENQPKEYGK